MKPYQERAIEEKKLLDEKLGKLQTFLTQPANKIPTLPEVEMKLLRRQAKIMELYSEVLAERLAGFGN